MSLPSATIVAPRPVPPATRPPRGAGSVVGRIAAIVDREHNRVHGDRTAFFGFFECENDPEAARALFGAAESAAREMLPGCDRLRGPLNPSMNDEVGALVYDESDPGPPFVMMPHTAPHTLELFAACGFMKERDLLAIIADGDQRSFARLAPLAERARRREKGLVVRPIRMDRYAEEVALLETIYNGAWERNWGFVPMTSEEVQAMARRLKPIIHPPYVLFAEVDGRPAGFHLALPDINQVLAKMNGSLFPFGWLTFLMGRRKIDRCRTIALGVLPEYRRRGIDAVLCYEALKAAIARRHAPIEMSWILEDNWDILRPLQVFGGQIYRRYRIVARPVPSDGA